MLAPPTSPLIERRRPPLPLSALALALVIAAALVVMITGLSASNDPVRHASRPAEPRPNPSPVAAIAGPPPPVAPTLYADMTPEQARADNAAQPFSGEKPRPAPPFKFTGIASDRAAARACLAAAVLYEAGDDAVGEQAVAQVVLNRLRHPAFPKTVCGVIFQGAERQTGCQFTFTCDGALDRPPSDVAWKRAQKVADAALSGHVDKTVGAATHYHADYVVPYWRSSLTKLVQVHAHIFYRWPGLWGSAAALTGKLQPFERLDPRLLPLAGPDAIAAPAFADLDIDMPGATPATPVLAAPVSLAIDGVPKAALKGAIVRAKDEAVAQYVLQLDPGTFAGTWAVASVAICAEHPDCLVLGWTGEDQTPRALPVGPAEMRLLAFMYRKSTALDVVQPSWDCRRFPRSQHGQCLPGTAPKPAATLPKPALLPVITIKPPPAPVSH